MAVAMLLLGPVPAANATATEDVCDTGRFEVLRDRALDLPVVTGVRITGLGDVCDGVAVGIQFMVNDAGDPALPSTVHSTSFSDEDPCTGADLAPAGAAQGGIVDVLLCQNHATAGYVPGREYVGMRLISGDGTEVLGVVIDQNPDPAPGPTPGLAIPRTGADAFRSLLMGAFFVLVGIALVRFRRRRQAAVPW